MVVLSFALWLFQARLASRIRSIRFSPGSAGRIKPRQVNTFVEIRRNPGLKSAAVQMRILLENRRLQPPFESGRTRTRLYGHGRGGRNLPCYLLGWHTSGFPAARRVSPSCTPAQDACLTAFGRCGRPTKCPALPIRLGISGELRECTSLHPITVRGRDENSNRWPGHTRSPNRDESFSKSDLKPGPGFRAEFVLTGFVLTGWVAAGARAAASIGQLRYSPDRRCRRLLGGCRMGRWHRAACGKHPPAAFPPVDLDHAHLRLRSIFFWSFQTSRSTTPSHRIQVPPAVGYSAGSRRRHAQRAAIRCALPWQSCR
jgi:hypothetical protein